MITKVTDKILNCLKVKSHQTSFDRSEIKNWSLVAPVIAENRARLLRNDAQMYYKSINTLTLNFYAKMFGYLCMY